MSTMIPLWLELFQGKPYCARSRSRSPRRKSRHSRSRSRTRERRRSRSRELKARERRRSRDREHHYRGRYRSRSRGRSRDRDQQQYKARVERVRQRFPEWKTTGQSERERMEKDLRVKIDKAKLRQIAIARAVVNMQTGRGPPIELKPGDMATLKAGGKSLDELTEYCKKIVERGERDSDHEGALLNSDDDLEAPFINHPFKVKEITNNIVMNIRNAKQLPALSAAQQMEASSKLRIQFPVSSGSQHRAKEWVPVQPTTAAAATGTVQTKPATSKAGDAAGTDAPATSDAAPTTAASTSTPATTTNTVTTVAVLGAPPADNVFPEAPKEPINLTDAVTKRLTALRKLQENPLDIEATSTLYRANQNMEKWAVSKQLPGQFTGSTGAQILTPDQLAGPTKHHAWVRKDTLTSSQPIKGGIGQFLLERMGWKQGEGLGKNSEGPVQPLMLDCKNDRKGLSSAEEAGQRRGAGRGGGGPPQARKPPGPRAPGQAHDLSGKHPVSALNEICNKRRWKAPNYIAVLECGPDHKKNFLFKVQVGGVEYQPNVASANKKHAKLQAALVCLQELGMMPRDYVISAS